MVPLIDKSSYLEEIENLPKLYSFYNLLTNKSIIEKVTDDEPEIDRYYFNFIKSFQENNNKHFSEYYNQFSRRKPSEESPWIHNDFLLFVIICGVMKYHLSKDWVLKVLSLRPNSTELNKSINITLNNIVTSNYNSNDNLFEIIIVFLDLLNLPQINNELFNLAYVSISQKFSQEYLKNDFARLIALRAFDIIILLKETPDSIEIFRLRNFKNIFWKRVKFFRELIYYTIVIIFFLLNLYLIFTSEDFKNYLNILNILAGIFGIGLISAFKWIRPFIGWVILKSFGYYKYYKDEKLLDK